MSHIELVVDRLILDGVPAPDRAALTAVIEAELERLLRSPALDAADSAEGAPARVVSSASDPRSLGVAVARAVFAQVPRGTLTGEDR